MTNSEKLHSCTILLVYNMANILRVNIFIMTKPGHCSSKIALLSDFVLLYLCYTVSHFNSLPQVHFFSTYTVSVLEGD